MNKEKMKGLTMLSAVIVCLNCDDSPLTPDSPVNKWYADTTEEPIPIPIPALTWVTGNSNPDPSPDFTAGHANWSSNGKIVTVDMTSNVSGYFGLACYYGPMDNPGNQTLVGGGENKWVAEGKDATLSAPLQCEVKNQCDWYFDLKKALKNGSYGEHRIAGKYYDGAECPSTSGPKCNRPDSCPSGQIFNEKLCECAPIIDPCSVITMPDCPEQTWNSDLCSWIGECSQ